MRVYLSLSLYIYVYIYIYTHLARAPDFKFGTSPLAKSRRSDTVAGEATSIDLVKHPEHSSSSFCLDRDFCKFIMYIYIYIHTYIHMHMCVYMYIYTYTYVCIYIYIYTYIHIVVCMCIYVPVQNWICRVNSGDFWFGWAGGWVSVGDRSGLGGAAVPAQTKNRNRSCEPWPRW